MTDERLAEIRNRWAKAARGDWPAECGPTMRTLIGSVWPRGNDATVIGAAIAAAPTDIAALRDEVERLRRERDALLEIMRQRHLANVAEVQDVKCWIEHEARAERLYAALPDALRAAVEGGDDE